MKPSVPLLGPLLKAPISQSLGRSILDAEELVAFRPWLHSLMNLYMVCSAAGFLFLLYGDVLLTSGRTAAAWLVLMVLALLVARRARQVRTEYFTSTLISAVSILGWVAITVEPFSTIIAFCNLIFITCGALTLTAGTGFLLLSLTLGGLFTIRSAQILLGVEAGLALPPHAWIQSGYIGLLFLIHFISVCFIVNLLWMQRQRNLEARTQVEESYASLRKAEESRRVFLSTVVHELRTPLTTIHGYVDLLAKSLTDEKLALPAIKRAATRLEKLMDESLNLVDPPSFAKRMKPAAIKLNDILAEELVAVESEARLRSIDIQVSPGAECVVFVDRLRMGQTVCNLLKNALEHTEEGNTVTLSVQSVGEWAELKVRDTGVGIAPEDLGHIFSPFYTKASAVKQRKGTGLGLAISAQIIEACGGRIFVESELGIGSTFTVRLPLVSPDSTLQSVQTQGALRALVLDDDFDIRALMQTVLSEMGFTVSTATTGSEALELALKHEYELLVLDVNVPEISGIDVSRRLYEHGCTGPVLLFSAMPEEEASAAVATAKAAGFISKPLQVEFLMAELKRLGFMSVQA